jgi:high-affinity K+ transport system ATPase subunit B
MTASQTSSQSELHDRRKKKNYIVLATLLAYMAIMFVVTIVRLSS